MHLCSCSPPRLAEDLGEEPLLASTNEADGVPRTEQAAAVTIPELLTSPELRRPLLTIVFATMSQQVSGMHLPHLLSKLSISRIKRRHQCRQDIHPIHLPLIC